MILRTGSTVARIGAVLASLLFACHREAIVVGKGSLRVIAKNLPAETRSVRVEVSRGDQPSKEPQLDGMTATAVFSQVPAGPVNVRVLAFAAGGAMIKDLSRTVTMRDGPQDEVFDFAGCPDGSQRGDGQPCTVRLDGAADAADGGPDAGPDAADDAEVGMPEDARPDAGEDAEQGAERPDADFRDALADAADVRIDPRCHCDGVQDAGEVLRGLTITEPLTFTLNTVRNGQLQSGRFRIENRGALDISADDIAIAGRFCAWTRPAMNGQYRDFPLPDAGLRPSFISAGGGSVVITGARPMMQPDDPPGVWYTYVALKTDGGAYVESAYNLCFTFEP